MSLNNFITKDTNSLGNGASKTAYKAINATNEENSLFTTDKHIDNIVILEAFKTNKYSKTDNKKINNTISELIKELRFQNIYSISNPPLGPKIYLITIKYGNIYKKNINKDEFLRNGLEIITDFIDAKAVSNILEIYVLEELCGPTPTKKAPPLVIDDNFFDKINNLIDNLINKSRLLFTDFKPQNTCPEYDEFGNLINVMGLDFDLGFTIKLSDLQNDASSELSQEIGQQIEIPMEKIISFSKDFMFIQFYYMLLRYGTNLTIQQKIFIRNKIMLVLPPEKLLYQMSLFLYISFDNILLISSKLNVDKIPLSNLASIFPIYSYTLYQTTYNKLNNIIYDKENKVTIKQSITHFSIQVLYPLFKELCKAFYSDINTYIDLTSFIEANDIINTPEKISIEELDAMPIVSYAEQEKEQDKQEEQKDEYVPINEKPKTEVIIKGTANYNIDEDMFESSNYIDSHEREHMEDMKAMYNGYGGKKRKNRSRKIKRY